MVDYGPQAPMNTTGHSSTALMGVSHTQGCCLLVLLGGSVVRLCYLTVGCRLPGTCLGGVLVKEQKADDILPVRMHKIRPLVLKAGKSLIHSRRKNALRVCRAPQRAQIAPGPRPMCVTGLLVPATERFTNRCLYGEMFEKVRVFLQSYVHV